MPDDNAKPAPISDSNNIDAEKLVNEKKIRNKREILQSSITYMQ
jgi:hypothetical protein